MGMPSEYFTAPLSDCRPAGRLPSESTNEGRSRPRRPQDPTCYTKGSIRIEGTA